MCFVETIKPCPERDAGHLVACCREESEDEEPCVKCESDDRRCDSEEKKSEEYHPSFFQSVCHGSERRSKKNDREIKDAETPSEVLIQAVFCECKRDCEPDGSVKEGCDKALKEQNTAHRI